MLPSLAVEHTDVGGIERGKGGARGAPFDSPLTPPHHGDRVQTSVDSRQLPALAYSLSPRAFLTFR